MPYETDQRLKNYLDTNQLGREQLCRAVLAVDKRFSDVRPRHPRGGPDGGRDIEAVYRQASLAYGAVGFINQANDSIEQKRRVSEKFKEDLETALAAEPKPQAFIFLTNINLTLREKDVLIKIARDSGLIDVDIFDRERIRIALDAPDGFSIRFQYLGLTLSDSEQASFFARWGDDIQSLIANGFQRIEKSLDRILFLQESMDVLDTLTFSFELDRIYDAEEIAHFRAFCYLQLKEVKHGIVAVLFGSSDRSDRLSPDNRSSESQPSGIKYGVCGAQWEWQISNFNDENSEIDDVRAAESAHEKYKPAGTMSGIGMQSAQFISIRYSHDQFIRIAPRLTLKDFDNAMFMPVVDKSLAEKLKAIHIYANGYKLMDIQRSNFRIDNTPFDPKIPIVFSDDELLTPWVRIRPEIASSFWLNFYEQTPKKLFSPSETIDSLNKTARNA
jgi:hypothetical protein